eukprot:3148238-Prymnesium_polylepis.1
MFHLSHAQAIETVPLLRGQVAHVVRSTARHVGAARGRMRRRPRFHVMLRPELTAWPESRECLVGTLE